MMRYLPGIVLSFMMLLSVPAGALETDLSDRKIGIRYSFEGADLILFGAVGHLDGEHLDHGFDVVVVVRGPEAPTVVRQKARINGIWINDLEVTFTSAPGYYAVAASRQLDEIASEEALKEAGIGFEYLNLAYKNDAGQAALYPEFKKALYRIREQAGLYRQEVDPVKIGAELFRTDVRLPANVPVGDFQVDAYIFRGGEVMAKNRIDLNVDKEGFERAAYTFAHGYPFFYGITAVLIALGAGWLAGVAGKK